MNTPDNIQELSKNEIFVFGSNKAGKHGGGAARLAYEKFGAEWGVGEGLTGKCYAFPTLDENYSKLSISELKESIDKLYKTCKENNTKIFFLTKVGCGIAGFQEEEIKELFKNSPKNLIKPKNW